MLWKDLKDLFLIQHTKYVCWVRKLNGKGEWKYILFIFEAHTFKWIIPEKKKKTWIHFCFIVWRGAPSLHAWRPQSPPSTATPKPSWSSSTSAGTLRRTWRSNRSCWSWTLRSRCGTCTSAPCRAPPRSCWTCQQTAASSPTPPFSWTSTTCQIHRERSTARRAAGSIS